MKAQYEFVSTHSVQQCDIADVQMDCRQNTDSIVVVECPCVIQQYRFKGKDRWICAELSSGSMCGSYEMSKIKQAIVGAIA